MSLSYNQLIQVNRSFVNAHHVLKNFGNGPAPETVLHDQESGYKYPLEWMEDLPSVIQPGRENFSFRFYFLAPVEMIDASDPDNVDGPLMSSNRNEVISDMRRCAQDVLSYWANQHDYPTIKIEQTTTINVVDETTLDSLHGVYFDANFYQAFTFNKCAIPMGTMLPLPDNCSPAFVYANDTLVFQVPSGDKYYFDIVDSNGTVVGVWDSVLQKFTVPTGTNGIDISLNSTLAFDNRMTDVSIPVVNTNDDTVGTWNGTKQVIADNTNQFQGNYTDPTPSGQNMNVQVLDQDDQETGILETVDANNMIIRVTTGSQYDPSAQALFDRVLELSPDGGVPDVFKPGIDSLIVGLKSMGIWYLPRFRMEICVPCLNAFVSLIDIKSLAVIATFNSASVGPPYNTARAEIPTFAGWKFNGGYVKSGFIPSLEMTLNNSCEFIGLFRDEPTGANTFNYGAFSAVGLSTAFTVRNAANALTADFYSTTVGSGRVSVAAWPGTNGDYLINRQSAVLGQVVHNGTVIGFVTSANGALPAIEEYWNCHNNVGAPGTRRNQSEICYKGNAGRALTTPETVTLSTLLSNFRTFSQRIFGVHTKQVVIDGNSHTVYWMSKTFRTIQWNLIIQGWSFDNVGVSGNSIDDRQTAFAAAVAPLYNAGYTKNLLLFYEGTNQMHAVGSTVLQTIAKYQTYINTANAAGFKPIIKKNFCRVRPSSGPGSVTYATTQIWNLAVDELNTRIETDLTGNFAVSQATTNHFIKRSDYASNAAYDTAVSALLAANMLNGTHITEAGQKAEGDIDTSVIQSQ